MALIIKWEVNRDAKTVTARALGMSSTAIFREGCGSILVNGVSTEALAAQPFFQKKSAARPTLDPALEWPVGNGPCLDPAAFGLDGDQINRALDYAFSEPDEGAKRKTGAVLVAYDGHLVAERYARGFTAEMPVLGWSMAKSVTSALVGVLVKKGALNIYDPAPVPEWRAPDDPRHNITIDQLLRMSSGLQFDEIYQPLHDATAMLYGAADFAAFAAAKPLKYKPDSVWSYSSGTANIVARIVRNRAEQLYDDFNEFSRTELFDKIGMASALVEMDPSGNFVGSSYGFATARDWARFGQLYLQDGVWSDERILPEGWVDYTATPTPGAPHGEYGAFFWLNAGAPDDPANRKWPDAPRDMIVAQGYQEQRVMIFPSKKLVVVRLGASETREAWDSNEFLKMLFKATSE